MSALLDFLVSWACWCTAIAACALVKVRLLRLVGVRVGVDVAVLVGVASAAEMSAVVAAAMSPPPDLDWDEMALDDPVALDPRAWAAA